MKIHHLFIILQMKIICLYLQMFFLFLFLHFIARRDCLTRSRLTAFKKEIHHFLFSASAHSRCLEFYFLSGKSFISLSQSFTMPSLIRVRSFTLDSTLRKIRNPDLGELEKNVNKKSLLI